MGRQNNSAHNHNILLTVLELMRLSINRLGHEYVIDLLRVTVRFMIETVNAKNQNHINEYVSSGIFEYSIRLIQEGLTEADGAFMNKINQNSVIKYEVEEQNMANKLDENSKARAQKLNLLKQEILWMVNCLITLETEHQIRNERNYNIINDFMVLNFVQVKILNDGSYTLDLFNNKSEISKIYNIN